MFCSSSQLQFTIARFPQVFHGSRVEVMENVSRYAKSTQLRGASSVVFVLAYLKINRVLVSYERRIQVHI